MTTSVCMIPRSRATQHLVSHAPQHGSGQTPTAVRGYRDQIGALLAGELQDLPGWVAPHAHFARDVGSVGREETATRANTSLVLMSKLNYTTYVRGCQRMGRWASRDRGGRTGSNRSQFVRLGQVEQLISAVAPCPLPHRARLVDPLQGPRELVHPLSRLRFDDGVYVREEGLRLDQHLHFPRFGARLQ